MSDYDVLEVPNVLLQRGGLLPLARLVYKTVGTLNPARDNAVLVNAPMAEHKATNRGRKKLHLDCAQTAFRLRNDCIFEISNVGNDIDET